MNSISLVSILVGFAYSGVIGFMAAYTKDLDLIWQVPSSLLYAVVITITRPLLGIVFDMKGKNFVLYPCFVSLALVFSYYPSLTPHGLCFYRLCLLVLDMVHLCPTDKLLLLK